MRKHERKIYIINKWTDFGFKHAKWMKMPDFKSIFENSYWFSEKSGTKLKINIEMEKKRADKQINGIIKKQFSAFSKWYGYFCRFGLIFYFIWI